jgi:hypothetical protein
MNPELKPCPFCKGSRLHIAVSHSNRGNGSCIACACGAFGPVGYGPEHMAAARRLWGFLKSAKKVRRSIRTKTKRKNASSLKFSL